MIFLIYAAETCPTRKSNAIVESAALCWTAVNLEQKLLNSSLARDISKMAEHRKPSSADVVSLAGTDRLSYCEPEVDIIPDAMKASTISYPGTQIEAVLSKRSSAPIKQAADKHACAKWIDFLQEPVLIEIAEMPAGDVNDDELILALQEGAKSSNLSKNSITTRLLIEFRDGTRSSDAAQQLFEVVEFPKVQKSVFSVNSVYR